MTGFSSSLQPFPAVRRAFERSRSEPQLLALAYEQLLPIIRSPTLLGLPDTACPAAGCLAGCPSFQE